MKKSTGEFLLIIALLILIAFLVLVFTNPELLGINSHDNNKNDPSLQLDFEIEENIDSKSPENKNDTPQTTSFEEGGQNSDIQLNQTVLSVDNEETFTGIIALGGINYQILQSNKVEIDSISLTLRNNLEPMSLEVLVYIYDLNDDGDKKGLVREQIWFGSVENNQIISTTKETSAIYLGDLSTEKEVKISLIGYKDGNSVNLGTDSKTFLFS